MPISTWIRDIFGIRKDVIDTKKSKLEVKKLEEEDSDRNLIRRASMDDVTKYDPTIRRIKRKAESEESELSSMPLWLILLAMLLAGIFEFCSGR